MKEPSRIMEHNANLFERKLLRSGKEDTIPSRSRAELFAALGLGLPPPSILPDAATPPGPATLPAEPTSLVGGLSAKAWVATVVAGGASVAAVWAGVNLTQETPSPARVADPETVTELQAPPPVEQDEAPALQPEPTEEHVTDEEPAPVRAVENRPKARKPAQPTANALAQELALIDRARAALRQGQPGVALRRLSSYSERYPKGSLRTEASVLRIEALVAQGNRASARRLGKAMLARSPNGPYARRVRSLLDLPEPNKTE